MIVNDISIVIGSWGSYNACNERALGSKWKNLSDYSDWEDIVTELEQEGFELNGIDEELFIQDIEGIEDFFFTRECSHTIYRVDSNGNYHSVKTEITRFKPDENLLIIDTEKQAVCSLRFFTEVEWGLSLEAVAAIDRFFENDMNYMLYERR